MTTDELMQQVNAYIGDTSRSTTETREGLEEVRDEIEIMIEALLEDEREGR